MAHRKVRSVAGKGRIGTRPRSLVVGADSHGADHCLAEGFVRILESRENPIGEGVGDLGHVVKAVEKAEAMVSKGCKQSVHHPRFKVDLNHCARFVFLSRAMD